MRTHAWIALSCLLCLALLCAACPEEEDDDREEAGEYAYRSAIAAQGWAALLDPYDSSIELFDPLAQSRHSIDEAERIEDWAVLGDGPNLAVLDGGLDRVLVIDPVGLDVVRGIDVGASANRLVVSPDGAHLLALYDPDAGEADYGEGGVINFFELTVIDAADGSSALLSIDFTPDAIAFDSTGAKCLLGQDSKVVYLDLESMHTISFPLTLNPGSAVKPATMRISPDGALALVSIENAVEVYVLDFAGPSINIIDMPSHPSDVLFVPDSHTALLPLPGTKELAVLDVDQGLPELIELEMLGAVALLSPDAKRVVLYNTSEALLTVVDLEEYDLEYIALSTAPNNNLDAPLAFLPDGQRLLVVGKAATDTDGASLINLVNLDSGVVTPIGFEGEFISYALGAQGIMAAPLPLQYKLVRLNLDTLQADTWDLAKYSRRVRYVPSARAFCVDYKDEEGKVTFVGEVGEDIYWSDKDFFDRWK